MVVQGYVAKPGCTVLMYLFLVGDFVVFDGWQGVTMIFTISIPSLSL